MQVPPPGGQLCNQCKWRHLNLQLKQFPQSYLLAATSTDFWELVHFLTSESLTLVLQWNRFNVDHLEESRGCAGATNTRVWLFLKSGAVLCSLLRNNQTLIWEVRAHHEYNSTGIRCHGHNWMIHKLASAKASKLLFSYPYFFGLWCFFEASLTTDTYRDQRTARRYLTQF